MEKDLRLGEFEQIVLTAVLRVGHSSYGIAVREETQKIKGVPVSLGAVYTTLDRLENKGLVTSSFSQPTRERGGRAKRYFKVEAQGMKALQLKQSVSLQLAQTLPQLERL